MQKAIKVKASIKGGKIEVPASIGATVVRVVGPPTYRGSTEVTPSDAEQVLPTTDKLVRDDITVYPAPTEVLSTDHNGVFTPSSGKVGFYQVNINVPVPSGSTTITQNGTYNVEQYASAVVDVPTGDFPSYDDVVLPSEYQRVEYIESSGTQYIDLPYGFAPTDTISMRASIDTSMGSDKLMVCPTRWNDNNNRFGLCGLSATKTFIFAYGVASTGDTAYAARYANDGDLHDFYYDDSIFHIVDLKRTGGVGGVTFGAESYSLRLFYGYNANTKGKIAYFVHTKADNRKIALFACYRKSDGVIGMYDIENNVFYTNDGTGDFTKGQDI